jgi:type IV secretion system protein VirB8
MHKNKPDKNYFAAGRDWYFERYENATVQANRWLVAFLGASAMALLLAIAVVTLLPLKTLVPLVIHQNTATGAISVDRPKTPYTPANDAQIQADLVRYLTLRESYSANDINQRFHLVMLLSAGKIGAEYAEIQANANKTAPINVLGQEGTRTVRVEDVVFIDKSGERDLRHFRQSSHNLVKVDFVTTTILPGKKIVEPWIATIEWVYKGLPQNQEDAWDNWNGFTVTTYRVDPRNVEMK